MIVPARIAAEKHVPETGQRRTASAALIPLADAVALLVGPLAPLAIRTVSPGEALGRIAGRDIRAARDEPPHATALRDGWAVRADDVLGASPYAPVLPPRAPVWVEAGSAMPGDTDAVLAFEAVAGRDVIDDAAAGTGLRAVGDEIGSGDCLVAAGTRITPLHRLALEAAGIAAVPVRVPYLRLVVAAAVERDTLSPFIAALIEAEGAVVTEVVRAGADPETIADALASHAADATLVLGGTGLGRNDHGAAGLARAGSVEAHGIALRPGETAGSGRVGERPVLLLPGRPDAALAAFLALGRPLIRALTGATPPIPAHAPLLRKVSSTIGLSEIVFARREADGVLPLGGQELPLSRLSVADAALLVAPDSEGHPAGTPVAVLPL